MMTSSKTAYSGVAALSICESLLLALNDHNILPESEIMGVLKDVAASHEASAAAHEADAVRDTAAPHADTEMHRGVAALINQIIAGGNSVRRR